MDLFQSEYANTSDRFAKYQNSHYSYIDYWDWKMKSTRETTIVLCDKLIKLYLRGYNRKEMTEVVRITNDKFDKCVGIIKDKYNIDLNILQASLKKKVP